MYSLKNTIDVNNTMDANNASIDDLEAIRYQELKETFARAEQNKLDAERNSFIAEHGIEQWQRFQQGRERAFSGLGNMLNNFMYNYERNALTVDPHTGNIVRLSELQNGDSSDNE